MSDIGSSLERTLKINGCLGAALVDYESGMCLGTLGNPGFDLELAAAGNADVVRAKFSIKEKIGVKDALEDILITLASQYHLIRPLKSAPNVKANTYPSTQIDYIAFNQKRPPFDDVHVR
ncbi:MAG: hypothetical protein EOP08_15730, partial [Proteobacteria bacterium]